jgi:hypothetical protein
MKNKNNLGENKEMTVSLSHKIYKSILDMAAVIRDEGHYVFETAHNGIGEECRIGFCGVEARFCGDQILALKTHDLSIEIGRPSVANDRPAETVNKKELIRIDFKYGDEETLRHWHREIIAFLPQNMNQPETA